MTEQDEKKRGRPRRDDRESILSERLGGIVVSKWERAGIDCRVEQLNREAAKLGAKVSVAGYIRSLIVADLAQHGCLAAGAGTAAELALEKPSDSDRTIESIKAFSQAKQEPVVTPAQPQVPSVEPSPPSATAPKAVPAHKAPTGKPRHGLASSPRRSAETSTASSNRGSRSAKG